MSNEHIEDNAARTIHALMEAQGITFEDVNKMIKLAQATPKALKVPRKDEPVPVYKGIATYTCTTCAYEFDKTFSTNKRNLHTQYAVTSCHECNARLLDCTKEELIDKIRMARKVQHYEIS